MASTAWDGRGAQEHPVVDDVAGALADAASRPRMRTAELTFTSVIETNHSLQSGGSNEKPQLPVR